MLTNGIEAGVEAATAPFRMRQYLQAVYLDLDGVLVNFIAGALKAHDFTAACLKPGEWRLDRCMGMTQERFWEKCCGHIFWEQLPWMHDGPEILQIVEGFAASAGIDFWLLSSPSDDIGSLSGKYAWLSTHMPQHRRKLILACNKAAVAKQGGLLIDDSDVNCRGWRGDHIRVGGEAILIPRWWNSEYQLAGDDNAGSLKWLIRRLERYKP